MELEESKFDNPMGEATGAASIFGVTGGVMEAALRTASEILEGKPLENLNFEEVRGRQGIKRACLTLAGKEINVAVVSGLSNAREIMEEVKLGKANFDFLEVMACPGRLYTRWRTTY